CAPPLYQGIPRAPLQDLAELGFDAVEVGPQDDACGLDLFAKESFPSRISPQLLAKEDLLQDVSDGIDGAVGDDELELALAFVEHDVEGRVNCWAVALRHRRKLRIALEALDRNLRAAKPREGFLQILQDRFHELARKTPFDGGEGPPLLLGRGGLPPAQHHLDAG